MLDRITLITGNAGKAAGYAAMLGIKVIPAKAKLTEVQSLDVIHIAARKAATCSYDSRAGMWAQHHRGIASNGAGDADVRDAQDNDSRRRLLTGCC